MRFSVRVIYRRPVRARPIVDDARKRLFRTMIRQASQDTPDSAGRYVQQTLCRCANYTTAKADALKGRILRGGGRSRGRNAQSPPRA